MLRFLLLYKLVSNRVLDWEIHATALLFVFEILIITTVGQLNVIIHLKHPQLSTGVVKVCEINMYSIFDVELGSKLFYFNFFK